MNKNHEEIEAKFYVRDLKKIEARLQEMGARLIQERVLEQNIRFDLPDGSLRSKRRVLRLRRDVANILTYKDSGAQSASDFNRREIEIEVNDFDTARNLLEALGYQVFFFYEKYRTTYESDLEGLLHIMLDELPYGSFVEIEGESVEAIQTGSNLIGLNWSAAVSSGYHMLFEYICKTKGFNFRDLSFENFRGLNITPNDLDVRAAD